MQERHTDYERYFRESEESCDKHYIPFLKEHIPLSQNAPCDILEVGCGIGGNIAPYASMGHRVTGIDIDANSIDWAKKIFLQRGLSGRFIHGDIHEYEDDSHYQLIVMHDVIEHIADKHRLMLRLQELIADDGVLYVAFPAWRMPFGGHQQVARTKFVSRCPFIHLLPRKLFVWLLRQLGESRGVIEDFLNIRDTRMTIQGFEKLCHKTGYKVIKQRLYFINPHYEAKFGIKPRILWKGIAGVPYIRDYFTTSYHCILRRR